MSKIMNDTHTLFDPVPIFFPVFSVHTTGVYNRTDESSDSVFSTSHDTRY